MSPLSISFSRLITGRKSWLLLEDFTSSHCLVTLVARVRRGLNICGCSGPLRGFDFRCFLQNFESIQAFSRHGCLWHDAPLIFQSSPHLPSARNHCFFAVTWCASMINSHTATIYRHKSCIWCNTTLERAVFFFFRGITNIPLRVATSTCTYVANCKPESLAWPQRSPGSCRRLSKQEHL